MGPVTLDPEGDSTVNMAAGNFTSVNRLWLHDCGDNFLDIHRTLGVDLETLRKRRQ